MPPSGSDLNGYAQANAKNQEAQRLADYYKLTQDPNASWEAIDRQGIGAGLVLPNQTLESVDRNNATQRYGYDTSAATSRANNADDNMTSIVNAAFGPLNPGQVRPQIPGEIAGVYGLPELEQELGQPKPMSETEVKGAALQLLTPEEQRTLALSDIPIESVIMDDGTTQYVNRPDAVGKAPIPTGQSLEVGADGSVRFGTGSGVSTAKPTEMTDRAGMFYNRASPASMSLDGAITEGYVPSDADYEGMLGAMSGLPNAVNRHLISPEGRKFYGNATNFMMAVLRPDTGAAFGPEEFQNYARVFVPLPGDTPDIIAQKSQARQIALTALRGTSRGASEQIAALLAEQGLPVPPEMEAVIARGGAKAGAPAAPAAAAPAVAPAGPPSAAVEYLRANPDAAADFDAKYGDGAAAAALGGGV